jgi:hypothetical protein
MSSGDDDKNEAPTVLTLSGKRTLWQNTQACRNWCTLAREVLRSENECVLQNGVKHVRKLPFLSQITIRLFPTKVIPI